jgi:hypothetical protein
MSAFRQMQTVMNDGDILVKALLKQFPQVQRFAVPTQMKGWGASRVQNHAHIIVANKYVGGYNDLGFRKGEDGNYKAIAEDDSKKLTPAWFDGLSRDYQEEKAMALMASNDMDLGERTVDNDGSVRLRFYVNA